MIFFHTFTLARFAIISLYLVIAKEYSLQKI